MNARVDLAQLLVKAASFAEQWRDQCGCNAQVLDELADAIESYLGTAPRLRGDPIKPYRELPLSAGLRARLEARTEARATRTVPGRNTSAITLEVKRADGSLVAFPPTATAVLDPDDMVQTPTLGEGRPLMARPVSGDEIYHARRLSRFISRDFLWITRLTDGRALFLLPWSGPGAQLSLGEFGGAVFTNTWDYHPGHTDAAWRAVLSWDGHGEPEGWTRHPTSGRVRPDGTAASEAVER